MDIRHLVMAMWRCVSMDGGAQCVTITTSGVRKMLRLSADSWVMTVSGDTCSIACEVNHTVLLIGQH